ncbi:MAG: 50S ribosomal protein L4 [Mycoplasma sp.]
MADIKIFDINGNDKGSIKVDQSLFVEKPNQQAMFDCVIAEQAAMRQGTHSTLTKGEVRGGGKKPRKQKHTGQARSGSTRNPHWVGGGVVFGPKPNRNYMKKVNSKVFRLALKSALTLKLNDKVLFGLDNKAKLDKPSTKAMVSFLENSKLTNKKVLVITNESDNIQLSTNNIPRVTTKTWNKVSVRDVMHSYVVIIQEDSINKMKELVA